MDNEQDGLISAELVTNSANAGTYSAIGTEASKVTLKNVVPGNGTKFENYYLTYQNINMVINKKSLEDSDKIKPKVTSTHVYNTAAQTPTVEVIYEVDSKTSLTVPASAYTLAGDGHGTDAINAKDKYKVTVTANENTNYTGSCDVY